MVAIYCYRLYTYSYRSFDNQDSQGNKNLSQRMRRKDESDLSFFLNFFQMAEEIISKVWQISGLVGSVKAGLLTWKNGHIAFITPEGIQFDEPLAEVKDVKWPFLRMGLGFDALVNGKKYKFSFTKPNPSAPELDDTDTDQLMRLFDAGRLMDSINTLRNLKADKATTKTWKEILKR